MVVNLCGLGVGRFAGGSDYCCRFAGIRLGAIWWRHRADRATGANGERGLQVAGERGDGKKHDRLLPGATKWHAVAMAWRERWDVSTGNGAIGGDDRLPNGRADKGRFYGQGLRDQLRGHGEKNGNYIVNSPG